MSWKDSKAITVQLGLQAKHLYYQTPVLGLGLGVDFTFAWDNRMRNFDSELKPNFTQ